MLSKIWHSALQMIISTQRKGLNTGWLSMQKFIYPSHKAIRQALSVGKSPVYGRSSSDSSISHT